MSIDLTIQPSSPADVRQWLRARGPGRQSGEADLEDELSWARTAKLCGLDYEADRLVEYALAAPDLSPDQLQQAADLLDEDRETGLLMGALGRLLRLDGRNVRALERLARLHLYLADHGAARSLAEQLRAIAPESSVAYMIRGAAAVLGAEPALAPDPLDRALGMRPDDPETLAWRAEASLALGRLTVARAFIEAGFAAMMKPGFAVTFTRARIDTALVLRSQITGEQLPEELSERSAWPAADFDRRYPMLLGVHLAPWADANEQALARHEPRVLRNLLERVLPWLGGNRSARPTRLVRGPRLELQPLVSDLSMGHQ